MNTLRQDLVAAVMTRFQTILVVNGYQTDAGANVFLWRVNPLNQSELPGIIVRDRRCETTLEGRTMHVHRIYFEAEVYALAGQDPRAVLGDLQTAIAKDIRWTAAGKLLAVDTQPESDELDATQEERLIRGCLYRFVVIIRTKPFNAFNLASPT